MKPLDLDLNLLSVILALYEERSVSRTAKRLGLGQPAVSGALAKLRESLDDPLFIRSGNTMQPTQRTLAMLDPIRDVLARVRQDILDSPRFDPSRLIGHVTFALSDAGEMVFLPKLLETIRGQAPQLLIRSVAVSHDALEEALESGEVDLAVGYFPDLQQANIFQQRLFDHHFLCLIRDDHPCARSPLTIERFLQLEHAVVQAPGRSQEIFEEFLKQQHFKRKVVVTTPHFLSIPSLIARSDLIVTVPHAIGVVFGKPVYGLKALAPPFQAPKIELRQFWHRKYHKAARNCWLRGLVTDLFNDAADEWTPKRSVATRPQLVRSRVAAADVFDAAARTAHG